MLYLGKGIGGQAWLINVGGFDSQSPLLLFMKVSIDRLSLIAALQYTIQTIVPKSLISRMCMEHYKFWHKMVFEFFSSLWKQIMAQVFLFYNFKNYIHEVLLCRVYCAFT